MHINPVKVSINGFAILFKIPSTHCGLLQSAITPLLRLEVLRDLSIHSMERTFVHTIIVQTEVEFHCISDEIQKI